MVSEHEVWNPMPRFESCILCYYVTLRSQSLNLSFLFWKMHNAIFFVGLL